MKKVLLTLIIVFVVFVGATGIFLGTAVNQDTIRNKIGQLVHDKTGRELTINGRIQWSFFPWLGVKLQDATLSNTPEFKGGMFAQAGKVNISVKLLPLIVGRIEGNNLKLKNFKLWLVKNNQGKGNWQDLLAARGKSNSLWHNLHINDIQLDNGNIFWLEQKTNSKVTINNLNFYSKDIGGFGASFPVRANFHWQMTDGMLSGDTKLNARVRLDIISKIYELQNLQLVGELKNEKMAKPIDFTGNTNILVDLNKQTLLAKNFNLHIVDAVITGFLQGSNIVTAPKFTGSLKLDNFAPKVLQQLFAVDQSWLNYSAAACKLKFAVTPQLIKLATIEAKLDDMTVHGSAHYAKAGDLGFEFAFNQLDITKLIQPMAATTVVATNKQNPDRVTALLDFFRKIKVAGAISVGKLQCKKLQLSNFVTNIAGDKGIIAWHKISSDLYQGTMQGKAGIDLSTAEPQLSLQLKLAEVAMQPLLIDTVGYNNFSGMLTLDTNIKMRGFASEAMLSSLDGSGSIAITNGAYYGIDIPYEIRRANAILKQKKPPQKSLPLHTSFDQLTANYKINSGLLSTDDFLIRASDYKVTGQGKVNLVSQYLDLQLNAYGLHDKSFFVPIKITGPFTEPLFKPDVAVAVRQVLKEEAKKRVAKHLQQLSMPQNLLNGL